MPTQMGLSKLCKPLPMTLMGQVLCTRTCDARGNTSCRHRSLNVSLNNRKSLKPNAMAPCHD